MLPHEQVNGAVFALQHALGRRAFLVVCAAVAAVVAGGFLAATRRAFAPSRERRALGLWGALLLAGMLGAELGLVSVVSEAVHFLQYAIATLLLLPLAGAAGEAMIWATLVGIADESFQYWVLHRDWGIYLDFNDIVLNAVGAALGGWVAVAALGLRGRSDAPRFSALRSRALVAAVLLLAAGLLLVGTGRVGLTAAEAGPGTWFVLDRGTPPTSFWTVAEWAEKRYHVLTPREGAAIVAVVWILFAAVDVWFEPLGARARRSAP